MVESKKFVFFAELVDLLRYDQNIWRNYSWRTLAYQEVILRISPLGKLGFFESTAKFFFVYIASISLASGQIFSITPWFAKVLHELSVTIKNIDLVGATSATSAYLLLKCW
jgi:hypothetical protein